MQQPRSLDDLIKEAVHDQIEHPVPAISATEAWQRLNGRLNVYQPVRKAVLAAAMLFIFLISVWVVPSEGYAFTKVTEIFHRIHGSVTEIFGSSADPVDPHAAGAPPKGMDEFTIANRHPLNTEPYTLEVAGKFVAFPIQVPSRVPEGFVFSHANIVGSGSGPSHEVRLVYNGNGRTFIIREADVMEGMGLGVTVNNENAQVSELQLNGWDASLLEFEDGSLELFWLTSSQYNSIKGELTLDEARTIALSLR